MKRTAFALLFIGLPLLAPAYADGVSLFPQPLDIKRSNVFRGPMQKQARLDRSATTDDYLIAVARAGNYNLLADVTAVPNTAPADPPPPFPTGPNNRLGNFVAYDLLRGRKLTMWEMDERTMLFWPSVEASQIAQVLRPLHAAAPPRNDPPPLEREQGHTMLKDYFERVHKWDGKWENVDIQVPVDDLPPDLRALVEAEIYREEVTGFYGDAPGPGGLDPGSPFWKRTRLVVEMNKRRAEDPLAPFLKTPTIRVRGGYSTGMKIGRLDSLTRR